jgi:hypothetical protein
MSGGTTVATSCAKLGPGNWLGTCLATPATLVAAGGLMVLNFGNGEVMVTLRPEGGIPAFDAGDEIVPSKQAFLPRDSPCEDVSERGHAVKGVRAGPVGGEGNIEAGGAVFGS